MKKAELLATQYLDSSNLGTRGAFNDRFTVKDTHPHEWSFDHVEVPTDATVLDLGCGPGAFWRENVDRIDERNWRPTLVDFSRGMVGDARDRLSASPLEPNYVVADGTHLPFEADTFDAVFAFMMLYHLPDLDAALEDINRVLAPEGRLYASAGAEGNAGTLYDLMNEVADGTVEPLSGGFTGSNGGDILRRTFSTVERHVLENTVRVDDPDAVVAYALSMPLDDARLAAFDPDDADSLRSVVADRIDEHGAVTWQKDTVLFVAGP